MCQAVTAKASIEGAIVLPLEGGRADIAPPDYREWGRTVGLPTICLTALQQLLNSSHHMKENGTCVTKCLPPTPCVFLFPRQLAAHTIPDDGNCIFKVEKKRVDIQQLTLCLALPSPRSMHGV